MAFQPIVDLAGKRIFGYEAQPNIVKLDMELIRNIDQDRMRQAIVRNSVALFRDLGSTPLAEGIETRAEMEYLRALGIDLMQGYYFAKPGFESLPPGPF